MKSKKPEDDLKLALVDSLIAVLFLIGLIAVLFMLSGCIADDSQTVNDCDSTGHDGQCWVFGVGNTKDTL